MSHETSGSNPYDSVDTDHPYLVPRKSGQIEAWHVETNEDGTPKVDEHGWIVLSGQNPELNAEGKLARPSKSAHPEALSDDVQSHFADILGQARPNATPEEFERYSVVNDELAETALEAIGLKEEEETSDERDPMLAELLEDRSFDDIGEISQQLKTANSMVGQELDQLDNLLSQAMYDGGSNEMINVQLRQSLESLQVLTSRGGLDEQLAYRVTPLVQRAIEVTDTLRRNESSREQDRYDARKAEESVGELDAANKTISSGYDEIRTILMPNGQFESYLEELIRTNQGYEYTISFLKSNISTMQDDVANVQARATMIEHVLDDLHRLKNR